MNASDDLHQRFVKDPVPVRLGGIASDLARLANMAKVPRVDSSLFEGVFCEIKFFSEWTAEDAGLEIQKKLLRLQRFLTKINYQSFSKETSVMAPELEKWSMVLLKSSGLLSRKRN